MFKKSVVCFAATAILAAAAGCCSVCPLAKKNCHKYPKPFGYEASVTPAPRVNPDSAVKTAWHLRWDAKREQIAQYKNDVQILFVGDSITHFWDNRGKEVLDKYFGNYRLLNIGYSGDRTGHTLWMVNSSGLLDNIKPQLVVLMIGTNNIGHRTASPAAAAAGVEAVVKALRAKLPESPILLFGIFPRGAKVNDPFRAQIKYINDIICKLDDQKNVFYCDITDKLLKKDGTLSPEIMPDYLHPGKDGYVIWADAIMPYVKKLVDKK